MKPVCVSCRRFYRPKKNGISFIEGMPLERNASPGNSMPEAWTPYKLWAADLWQCPSCGHQLIPDSSTGREPLNEHYRESFTADVRTYKPIIQVNDC